jgi:hypothetical protein
LCAQPFDWLTLVEVTKTLLLPSVDVQKPGEGNLGRAGRTGAFWPGKKGADEPLSERSFGAGSRPLGLVFEGLETPFTGAGVSEARAGGERPPRAS